MASVFNTSILKESSAITGKKKPERKARHLLADLPLPPELPGIAIGSPHSPPDDKKTATPRKRPKYVVKQSLLQHLHMLAKLNLICVCIAEYVVHASERSRRRRSIGESGALTSLKSLGSLEKVLMDRCTKPRTKTLVRCSQTPIYSGGQNDSNTSISSR